LTADESAPGRMQLVYRQQQQPVIVYVHL